jgi:pectin methylesterase-like acyl-CoA thioesterase
MQPSSLLRFLTGLVAAATAGSLSAQQTFLVNAGGGPGVNFTSLPPAIAAAADGDTIVVQAGPFGEGAVGFTTSKGITILGQGGAVPV